MYQRPQSTPLSIRESAPLPLGIIQLWLEEEDKAESERIGRLKKEQKEKQRLINEQLKRQRQQDAPPPEPPVR
jgi:hypothetical protein